MVVSGRAGGAWAGVGVAWWARQAACLQASEQKRRRPEGAKLVAHQAQAGTLGIVTVS